MQEQEKETREKEQAPDIDDEKFLKKIKSQTQTKKSKTGVLLGILAVIVVIGIAIAYFSSAQNTESSTKKEPPKPLILKLEPFIVNLADKTFNQSDMKYIKASVEIEFADEYSLKLAESRMPQIRDAVIGILTQLTSQEIITPEGKLLFKDEIKQIVSGITGEKNVKGVYLSELVMQ